MTCALICFSSLRLGCKLTPIIYGFLPALVDLRLEARAKRQKACFMSCAAARGRGMAAEKCQHPDQVRGVVDLDVSRPETPADHSVYSVEVSIVVCEECGHVELYAKSHHALCDWLRKKS